MNKEEILQKSRAENGGQDLYTQELLKKYFSLGFFVVFTLVTIFFVCEMIFKKNVNYSLFAINELIMVILLYGHWKTYKKKVFLICAVIIAICCVFISILHLFSLIN